MSLLPGGRRRPPLPAKFKRGRPRKPTPSFLELKLPKPKRPKEQAPAIERLWGNAAWRDLPIMKAYAWKKLADSDVERFTESYATAFSKRVATLGYDHYGCVGPLRNDQGAPMYHLQFFSKSPKGLAIWKGIGQIEPGGQRRLKGFDGD